MNTKLTSFVKTLAMAVCIVGLVTGCEEKNGVTDEPNVEPGVPAYMSVSVQLPTAGSAQYAPGMEQRLPFGNNETEVGSDAENTVTEVLLVLADNNNKYCLHGVAANNTTSANLSVTAKFEQTGIAMFYDEDGNLKSEYNTIRVFVFCNPTQHLKDALDKITEADKTSWMNLTCSHQSFNNVPFGQKSPIWTAGTFLMSNYSIATRKLPGSLSAWSQYNTTDRAFSLSTDNNGTVDNKTNAGAIEVERSVARLDFKDGSGNNTNPNTYSISETDGKNLMNVQLVRMGLVNMSNKFYYLRHMAEANTDETAAVTTITLLDKETQSNYVMDVDADYKLEKIDKNYDYGKLHNMFEYPLYDENGKINDGVREKWDNWYINGNNGNPGVLENDEDDPGYTKEGYHVWRYITENTIPANDQQVTAYSTGVVFKGKLLAGKDLETGSDLNKAINGNYENSTATPDYVETIETKEYPILFLFQNQLYVGFKNGVMKSAEYKEEGNTSAIYLAVNETADGTDKSPLDYYNELINAKQNNQDITTALDNFRKAATAAGFTLYQASKGENDGAGYYFYYYYWIRHRNNSDNNTMGPMEFATVRNNVYKLSVTKISKIGYPRIQDNNPDPIDPENPDETTERYITVEVKVLPWVVRENNIEF